MGRDYRTYWAERSIEGWCKKARRFLSDKETAKLSEIEDLLRWACSEEGWRCCKEAGVSPLLLLCVSEKVRERLWT